MDQNYKMYIAKRNATGTIDTSFGTNSIATVDFTDTYYDSVNSITGHEFGSSFKIILVGRTRTQSTSAISNISLARINANGTLDTTFGTAGKVSVPTNFSDYYSYLFSEIDSNNGKLYVMGLSNTNTVSLYRFNLSSILSNQEFSKPQITFSPNPTNSQITFSQEISNLEIFDISGKKVKTFENANTNYDVSSLDKGIYLIKGKNNEGIIFNEKLIKN
jgi:hypothetical protein